MKELVSISPRSRWALGVVVAMISAIVLIATAGAASAQADGQATSTPNIIRNTVFLDLDGNGSRSGGEPTLASVTVRLIDGSGTVLATTTTDANGQYTFRPAEGVEPGVNYTIRLDTSTNSSPLPGGSFNADLASRDVTVRAGRVNNSPVLGSYDLALRVSADTATINRSAKTISFNLTVINQGRSVDSFQIIDYFDYDRAGAWADFVPGLNPAGSAGGRSWSWNARNPQRPIVTVNGTLGTGQQVSIPVVMRWNDSLPASVTQIENWAEIVSFSDGGSGNLVDRDSTPDRQANNDNQPSGAGAATDDDVRNAGGDEDDHDVAGFTIPADEFDLALIKQVSNGSNLATIVPGSRVSFRITVINQGDVSASGIVITDYLPTAGLRLADPSWTERTNGTADISIPGRLAPGARTSVDIDFVATSNAQGQINNWAEISAAEAVDSSGRELLNSRTGRAFRDVDSTFDRNAGNDQRPAGPNGATDDEINGASGDEDDHDVAGVRIGEFDLALSSTVAGSGGDTGIAPIGNAVVFNLRISNEGSVPATDVVLTDYLPRSGLTLVDPDWQNNGDGTATLKRPVSGPILPGDSVVVPITFIVNSDAEGTIYNWAEIASADTDGDSSTPVPRDRDSFPNNNPRYDSTPGSLVDFDAIQAGATPAPAASVANDVADADDDAEDTAEVANAPTTSTARTNVPRAASEDDHDVSGVTVEPPFFDLALQVQLADDIEPGDLTLGDGVFFEITIFNQGNVFAGDVELIDYFPATGLIFDSQSWTDQGNGTATIQLEEPIAPDTSTTVEVRFEVADGALGSIENTIEVGSATAVDSFGEPIVDGDGVRLTDDDSRPGNGPTTGEDDTSTASVDFPAPPEYDLALFADLADGSERSFFEPGDSVTYDVTVLNNGVVNSSDITLAVDVPDGFTVVERGWNTFNGVAMHTLRGRLLPGESMTFGIEFRADASASGNFDNIIRIDSSVSVDDVGAEILGTDGNTLRDVNPGDDSVILELNVIPSLAFNGVDVNMQSLLGWGLLAALAFAALIAVTFRRKTTPTGVRMGLVGPAASRFGPTQ